MEKRLKQTRVPFRRVLYVSILIFGLSLFSSMRLNTTTISSNPPSYSSSTLHNPISIISDSGFEVFPGSGTVEDPYLIDGYNITTTSTTGIYVYRTTKYFIICNCYVDAGDYGILISNIAVGTATVINNTCNNNNYVGILLVISGSATVINNTCSNNNWDGISFLSSGSATVVNNTCSNNNWYGINLDSSESATVINNMCENNNYHGINLDSSGSATVINNTCNSNSKGIRLLNSRSSTIANNTCSNNNYHSIEIYYSGSATVVNNTCNNNNYGILLWDSGNSTASNNTCNSNDEGISLWFSGSATVTNNTCNNNYYEGIKLYSSSYSTVVSNTFTNCGLYIDEDTADAYLSNTVEDNWVNGKKLGYYTNLDSTTIAEPVYGQLILVNCTNVTVRDQILNNTTAGLFLYSCTYSVIINNTCNNNYYEGIKLYYSGSATVENNTCNSNSVGIRLHYSGSATVVNNTCINNYYGIFLASSAFCVVTYNLLQENERYGVYSSSSSDNNIVHHNTFEDNNLGGTSQAKDDGANNFWYDAETSEGNYWSDWSGTGNYSIDGSADLVDLYPLDEPVEYSTVVSTTDETQIYFPFILLIVVVPLILMKLFSRKKR